MIQYNQSTIIKNYQEASEILRNHLKEQGFRQTPERFSVLEELYTSEGHFNADELFLRMKNKGSRISRATVYNTLELLVHCNLVECHQFGHNHMHYERAYGFQHHDHLICNHCGDIIEFSMPELEMLQDEACLRLGFTPDRHSLQIFGSCKPCTVKAGSVK